MKLKGYIYMLITLLWIGVIFSFSLQPADTSSHVSASVGRWLMETFFPNLIGKLDAMPQEKLQFLHFLLRKTGHVSEYFILGGLSILTFMQIKFQYKKILGIVFCALVASVDETIQLFVKGRSGQISDVMLDCVGAMTGILGVMLVRMWWYRRKNKEKGE